MQREGAALFQGAQGFQEVLLPVAGNVVIHVIAHHGIEGLVREIQAGGISLPEGNPADPLGPGVAFAQAFAEGGILPAPAVDADDLSPGVPFAHRDSQRPTAAAHIQNLAAVGQLHISRRAFDDLPGHLALSVIVRV